MISDDTDRSPRDYADYDPVHTVTTTANKTEPLTIGAIAKTLEDLGISTKRTPITVKDFKFSIDIPAPEVTGTDLGFGPDITMLSKYQYGQLIGSVKLEPTPYMMCSWASMMATSEPTINNMSPPYSRKQLRVLRKQARSSSAKKLVKRIARNPLLCEQDPRKLKRLARRKAEHDASNS